MKPLKVRASGAWVDSDKSGAVRYQGSTIAFGPTLSGPSYESLAWANPPTGTNYEDSGETYNMGIRFSLVAAKPCYGIRWRVPDTLTTPPGGTHYISLWKVGDASLVAYKAVTPTPGGYQDLLFDTPTAPLSTGEFWVAAVYTKRYSFRSSGGVYPSSPSGNVVADEGRLVGNNSGIIANMYPAPAFSAHYFVSPLIGI